MAIRIECESCFSKIKVRDQALGKRISCPSCGLVIVISKNRQGSKERRGRSTEGRNHSQKSKRVNRFVEMVGIPNIVATLLSLCLILLFATRPHFAPGSLETWSILFVFASMAFCFSNGIAFARELARTDRENAIATIMLGLLGVGVFRLRSLTPRGRQYRNGIFFGLLMLVVAVVCFTLNGM